MLLKVPSGRNLLEEEGREGNLKPSLRYSDQRRDCWTVAHFVVHLFGLELGQGEADLGRRGRGGEIEGGGRRVVVVAVHDAVLLSVGRTEWKEGGAESFGHGCVNFSSEKLRKF